MIELSQLFYIVVVSLTYTEKLIFILFTLIKQPYHILELQLFLFFTF